MLRKRAGRFVTICETELLRKRGVTEVTCDTSFTHFVIPLHGSGVKVAQEQVRIVCALSEANIKLMLVKFHPHALHFTVRSAEQSEALKVLKSLRLKREPKMTGNCCLIAVVSSAMRDLPGVMSRIAEAALRLSVDVLEISDTKSAVLLLVGEAKAELFKNALCQAFGIKPSKRTGHSSAM
ncbi:MAG: hypothetical protein RMK18_03050 [Armatimonadota bacterium]|nr:hypothetical protein [Armatimonadota bacterium]MCX7776993.1 hypothetical protein [Armatimonadota bacterium]MDW8024827.1 hypothetical protein [Armatimonadota bacterium]